MYNLSLLVGRGSTYYDYSNLINKVTWTGRKGAAPRSITVSLMDSEGYSQGRAAVNCGEGQTCILSLNKKEIFRGLLMADAYSSKRMLTLKASDDCVRLSNNKDSFSYKKKRADQIVRDCLKKLGLKAGTIVNTGFVIGELVKKNTTYWDVIQEALSRTYKATGKRYYLYAEKGKIYLKRRTVGSKVLVFDPTTNVESYERKRSIEKARTRIKLTTSKGKTKKSYTNTALEKKIGMFQQIDNVDEDATATELNQRISVFKQEESVVSQELSVTGVGDVSLIAGGCVYVKIPHLSTKRVMYIDEDTHTFEKGCHKMTLKLNYAKTIDAAG